MQDEQQFEQLMLQYTQLKNSAEEISRMIDNDDYDSALTMLNGRESIFLNCKCMRNFLELTPVQQKQLDMLLEELRALEMNNIKKIEQGMASVQAELRKSQQVKKIHRAYEFETESSGSIVNTEE